MQRILGWISAFLLTPVAVYAATLEIPGSGATLSGIGVISGWKCDAGAMTVRFNGGPPLPLAYPNERADTASVCGDTDNGFVSIMNWGNLDEGDHTAVVYDDGREFDRSTFTVVTPGVDFLRGETGRGEAVLSNGQHVQLVWQEASQSFEATTFTALPDEAICTTKTTAVSQAWSGSEESAQDEEARMTVTNPCDGHTLHFTMTAITDQFNFECHDLRFVQPPGTGRHREEGYVYGGHGYQDLDGWNGDYTHYVTLHQPGNTTGICHNLAAGQTRTFRVSVDPERVDNPVPLNFLEPFQVYFGSNEERRLTAEYLLFEFPTQ